MSAFVFSVSECLLDTGFFALEQTRTLSQCMVFARPSTPAATPPSVSTAGGTTLYTRNAVNKERSRCPTVQFRALCGRRWKRKRRKRKQGRSRRSWILRSSLGRKSLLVRESFTLPPNISCVTIRCVIDFLSSTNSYLHLLEYYSRSLSPKNQLFEIRWFQCDRNPPRGTFPLCTMSPFTSTTSSASFLDI